MHIMNALFIILFPIRVATECPRQLHMQFQAKKKVLRSLVGTNPSEENFFVVVEGGFIRL